MWDYPTIRRHSSSLSSARAIDWSSQKNHNWWKKRSSDSLSVSGASFRHVLSIISGPSSLHTLVLTWLNVKPAQQQLILSIKSLRFLKLINSSFVPTPMVLPRSSITTLWLEDPSVAPIKHLLTLLASSLETLRSRGPWPGAINVLGSTQLPRLTFFEELYQEHFPRWEHFASFSNIKVLIISSFGIHFPPKDILPHLTYLCAPHNIASALLPGRPVRTYHMHPNYFCCGLPHSRPPLAEVAPDAQHVEELQLSTRMPPGELVEHLAMHFPNLVRVRLMMVEFPLPTNEESALVPPSGSAYVHHSLREIDIGFHRVKGRPFPSESCWNALTTLKGICPGLEVVRFGELFPVAGGGIDERNVGLDWLMDVRRATTDGEWKERKWGLS